MLVAVGLGWSGAPTVPGELGRRVSCEGEGEGVRVSAPPSSTAAERHPPAALHLTWSPRSLDELSDDRLLFTDGTSRDEPWVTATVKPRAAWTLTLTPDLTGSSGAGEAAGSRHTPDRPGSGPGEEAASSRHTPWSLRSGGRLLAQPEPCRQEVDSSPNPSRANRCATSGSAPRKVR